MRMILRVGEEKGCSLFNIKKRGSAEDVMWPEVVWIILFLIYAVVFVIFIKDSIYGAAAYEDIYAKKIALIIDGARPGTDVKVEVTDAFKVAEKTKKSRERAMSESFSIDKINNNVKVSLGSRTGGTLYYYFSDYNVSLSSLNLGKDGRVTVQITVREKNDAK